MPSAWQCLVHSKSYLNILIAILQEHWLTVGLRRITVFSSKHVVIGGRVAPYRNKKPQGSVMAHFKPIAGVWRGLILLTIDLAESCFGELMIMNDRLYRGREGRGKDHWDKTMNESKYFGGIATNQPYSQCQGSNNSCFFSSLLPSEQPAEILPEPCVWRISSLLSSLSSYPL